jgi:hypothetical protein
MRVRTEFALEPKNWTSPIYLILSIIVPTRYTVKLKSSNQKMPQNHCASMLHCHIDANLMHDITSGKSVTGILHLVNKTPIDCYSKKQATVETVTYGSEFVAARVCVEQLIDLRTTQRYLGVPIRDKSYVFGDNKSVVDSSMQLHAKLHKRHTMLSFHRIREAIASGIVGFFYIPGDINPADIFSKHWGYSQIREHLESLLFWKGDTADILLENPTSQAKGE